MSPLLTAARRLFVLALLAGTLLSLTAALATAHVAPAPDAQADDGTSRGTVVEILPLTGFLDPPVVAQIVDVIDQAAAEGSDLIVLQINAGGGVSVDVDRLLDAVESSPVPVAVLVGPVGTGARAAGAGGLLWLAADIRAVAADASVGPVLPADLGTQPGANDEHARVAGYLGDQHAASVEPLLTGRLTAAELAEAGIADLEVQGLEPLLVELDGRTVVTVAGEATLRTTHGDLSVRFHSLGLIRRMLHAATTAPFIYLLLVAGLTMLLFELFQPGFGVAGLAGIITAAIGIFGLTVLPVTWWAVALVVLGLILYAVDTAVAGFGLLTLAATATFLVGSVNFYAAEVLDLPWWLVAATALTVLTFFVFILTALLRAQAGPEGVAVDDLVGKVGMVRSVLNPEGHVYIDGALWRARWTGDSRRAKVGTPVRVHAVEGPVVLVEAFDPSAKQQAVRQGAGDIVDDH